MQSPMVQPMAPVGVWFTENCYLPTTSGCVVEFASPSQLALRKTPKIRDQERRAKRRAAKRRVKLTSPLRCQIHGDAV